MKKVQENDITSVEGMNAVLVPASKDTVQYRANTSQKKAPTTSSGYIIVL